MKRLMLIVLVLIMIVLAATAVSSQIGYDVQCEKTLFYISPAPDKNDPHPNAYWWARRELKRSKIAANGDLICRYSPKDFKIILP